MLVAQITDIHLGFDRGNPGEFNRKRLEALVARLTGLDPQPDVLLVTGDLVEHGDRESYARVRDALAPLPMPVLPCLGNHDLRAAFRVEMPHVPVMDSGHVQYVHDAGPLRIIMLDTLDEGRHGGAFCAVRAAWLADRLAEEPLKPTLLVLHHPPVDTGIPWLTVDLQEPWIARLREAVSGHPQIVGLVCGHVHRSMVTRWAGLPLAVCSSSAPQVALELAAIDPERPDNRPMIVADAPAFALHRWTGEGLLTHFDTAEDHVPLARYDGRLQGLVRHLLAERAAA